MKNFVYFVAQISFLVLLVFSVLTVARSLHSSPPNHNSESLGREGGSRGDERNNITPKGLGGKEEVGMELYPTGSTLPDCSHACGPCFPCKRVIVSFKCPMAESCPVVYRCMCKGKYYQVPSN